MTNNNKCGQVIIEGSFRFHIMPSYQNLMALKRLYEQTRAVTPISDQFTICDKTLTKARPAVPKSTYFS